MSAHALLSPSSAHRWLNCPAAPLLESKMPDQGSDFAREGSLAHAIAACKLKDVLCEDSLSELKEIARLKGDYYAGEMEEYTDDYVSLVLSAYDNARAATPDARLLVEQRLDFSRWVPESFGTADAVIIADGVMEVIDFKYGKGVAVSAENNPQMMIYALGALEAYGFEYDIRRVVMTICQPRKENLSTWALTVEELSKWADEVLSPAAARAMSGDGEQKSGDWCRFCRVRACCRKLAEDNLSASAAFDDPRLLSPEDMAARVLPVLPRVKAWMGAVEEHVLQQALDGVRYPGYKVVEGRSVRKVTNPEGLRAVLLEQGYHPDDVTRPMELRTITDLEKLCGRKRFAELSAGYIDKPAGKPTLVVASDKRPAWNSAVSDFKEFTSTN